MLSYQLNSLNCSCRATNRISSEISLLTSWSASSPTSESYPADKQRNRQSENISTVNLGGGDYSLPSVVNSWAQYFRIWTIHSTNRKHNINNKHHTRYTDQWLQRIYTIWLKIQDAVLLLITSPNEMLIDFQNSSTTWIISKYAINCRLMISSYLNRVVPVFLAECSHISSVCMHFGLRLTCLQSVVCVCVHHSLLSDVSSPQVNVLKRFEMWYNL